MTGTLRQQRRQSPSRSQHQLPGRLRYSLFLLSVSLSVFWAFTPQVPAVQSAEGTEDKQKGVYEVRQGGYVEKVDPNVDYKDRLPRILPKPPAESMKTFQVIPGLEIRQVVTEPLICDPVDMVFDSRGRLYVAELVNYAEKQQTGDPRSDHGRVSIIEDLDGDGRFDKSTVFVDNLTWPTGLLCFDGGLFVATTPELIYCKDTDGDGKSDQSQVFISGFDTSNPNACPNSLRWGLDNRIHGMASTSGGKIQAVKWQSDGEDRNAEPVESRGRDFSFHPRTGQLRLESGGSQFGMSFDVWGRKFESSNSVPIEMVMYDDRYIARNPYLAAPSSRLKIYKSGNAIYRTSPVEPWRILRTELRIKGTFSGPVEGGGTPAGYFTGACGVYVYKGDAWPEQFHGNAFVAEGSGNLVHRMRLEPNGVAIAAHRTEEKHEFITSDEVWFRPIQFVDGPDGNLYMADMYRETYEHPDAIPPSARKYLNLLSGSDRGRVYRLMPQGFKQPPPVRLDEMSTVELVGLMEHANGWHRNTASRLLYERQDRKALVPLEKMAAESTSPLGRMHALYGLDGQEALTADVILARLDDEHPRVREHAVRLAEKVLADSPAVREKLYSMTGDEDLRVRHQLAYTLGEIAGTKSTIALGAIIKRDVDDKWVRLAVLSSLFGRAGELSVHLAADEEFCDSKNGLTFIGQAAEQAGLQKRSDQVAEVLSLLEGLDAEKKELAQAIVRGLSKGLAESGNPLLASLNSSGGSKAGQLLAEMVQQSKSLAADAEQALDQRVAAIRSLGLAAFDESADILSDLLDSRQPQEIQVAALQALSRFQEAEVPDMIVDAWLGFTPKVRGEAAEALFARPERLAVLLAAIEDEVIGPSQLDPLRIDFLLSHPDEDIRQQATDLLGGAKLAPREDVVQAWREVLSMTGDAPSGKEVFKRDCSKCHLLEGVGVELGLPLNTIGNRGPETILLAVLDPNREVNPAYLNYVVITNEGLSMTGMISSETATSITLNRAEGESDTVLRANIDELVNTGQSIMPEGQEKLLTKQEMADVIQYLMSLE